MKRWGAVGAGLEYASGRLQLSCGRPPHPVRAILTYTRLARLAPRLLDRQRYAGWDHASTRAVGWVSGAALLTSRSLFRQLGGSTRPSSYIQKTPTCAGGSGRRGTRCIISPGPPSSTWRARARDSTGYPLCCAISAPPCIFTPSIAGRAGRPLGLHGASGGTVPFPGGEGDLTASRGKIDSERPSSDGAGEAAACE